MIEILFSLEGISSVGKSTLQNELRKLDVSLIFFDGISMIEDVPDMWDKRVSIEHFILNRFNRMNFDKAFICDRLFSGAVYEIDSEKWLRFFQFHFHPRVIYLDAEDKILGERFTKDVTVEHTRQKYEKLLQKFKHLRIDTSNKTPEQVAHEALNYIYGELESIARVKKNE